jgi:transposase
VTRSSPCPATRARISWTCRLATGCGHDWCPVEHNQIRAFLIEQGIAVRVGPRALRKSLFAILENRKEEISPRTAKLIRDLYEDWCCLDERIESVTGEIEILSRSEAKCRQLMSVPGVGPLISTAIVAAIGSGEAFERGHDFAAWLGLVPRQYSTGGRSNSRGLDQVRD